MDLRQRADPASTGPRPSAVVAVLVGERRAGEPDPGDGARAHHVRAGAGGDVEGEVATLAAARKNLEAAIEKNLYVTDSATVGHFREGQDDDRIPIDVQALGGMYFDSHRDSRGAKVGRYITKQPGFYIAPRTTTAASNKVSGMKPFLDAGSPNLIWSEGTIESQMAMTRLGSPDTFLKSSVESLKETMEPDTVGPIGADRDSDSDWGQYRTWPTSAAASWLLMNELEEKVYLFQP